MSRRNPGKTELVRRPLRLRGAWQLLVESQEPEQLELELPERPDKPRAGPTMCRPDPQSHEDVGDAKADEIDADSRR